MSAEIEPIGITFDRLRLGAVQADLVRRFGWTRVIEVRAGGAKAKPSLYSLGFARAGCRVDLQGGSPEALDDWRALGLGGRVRLLDDDLDGLASSGRSWDVAWNFVTASRERAFVRMLGAMSRLAPHVMTVHCNGMHYGQPWHRFLHSALALEWTHGAWENEFPGMVGLAYRTAGLETAAVGFFDAPGWPDPPGFRDVRLHLSGVSGGEDSVSWHAPIVDIYRTGSVPLALRLLALGEKLQPLLVRAVLAHLYLHVGEKR
ncbi:MAG: hypothetical protein JRG91_14355 [Deltaproteobacteria bacterium]|nr:hypothetical protein [Deltaproteobacteria bacterium]